MRPDALILPESIKEGPTFRDRVISVINKSEPILEPDYKAGEQVYVRRQHGGVVFITRDPYDSLYFPEDHPRAGQPRYRWEDKGRGIQFGYLLEPVEAQAEAPPEVPIREYLEGIVRGS